MNVSEGSHLSLTSSHLFRAESVMTYTVMVLAIFIRVFSTSFCNLCLMSVHTLVILFFGLKSAAYTPHDTVSAFSYASRSHLSMKASRLGSFQHSIDDM